MTCQLLSCQDEFLSPFFSTKIREKNVEGNLKEQELHEISLAIFSWIDPCAARVTENLLVYKG